MKISLNQTTQINRYNNSQILKENQPLNKEFSYSQELPPAGLSLAQFHNITFGLHKKPNPDMEFLLSYADKLRCAYSGRIMLSKAKAKSIYQKLEKRPTAQTAINLLQSYQDYMHPTERFVFDILSDAPYKNKRDFQDILKEYLPQSLEQLKIKQRLILNSANKTIDKLPENLKEQLIKIRDEAISKIDDGSFTRKDPLEKLRAIKAARSDAQKIMNIYYKWYKLPSSSKDLDAFIVKYSKESHQAIAKRLISPSVATIEHVKPRTRGGANGLSNMILVSAEYNNARHSMSLWEYMMLNPDLNIAKNLQKYFDEVIKEIHTKNSGFAERSWYPQNAIDIIDKETLGLVQIDIDHLHLTKSQRRENSYPERLKKRFGS